MLSRRRIAGLAAAAALVALSGGLSANAASASGLPSFIAVSPPQAGAAQAGAGQAAGGYSSARMSVEVLLAPRHQAALGRQLAARYAHPGRAGRWLARGQFAARYGPSAAQRAAVSRYLAGAGLAVSGTGSPFLIRAAGTSAQIAAAFRTSLRTYSAHGTRYFANSTAAVLPRVLAAAVTGVVGLSDTVREHPMISLSAARPASAGCELPYPSEAALTKAVKQGTVLPAGYGAAPGCNGLTPGQDNGIYGAPAASPRTRGHGVALAVFELSGYLPSDIRAWAATYYGPSYSAPVSNVNVDGGPVTPACPAGDTCPASANGYSSDIEVSADIEMQLAIAPDAARLLVYNAPNDDTGQTVLDELSRIAGDDSADSVSTSWGECEAAAGAGFAQAENLIFEQMALQGQSMFGPSGDTGAFDCLNADGSTAPRVDDPASQPWVTSVGATSLESFNPGQDASPAYPAGAETVWNPYNLCSTSARESGKPGSFWCSNLGAGGGGSSMFWGRPSYQSGPGVTDAGHCSLAAPGAPCREVPDISANGDPQTGYGEYCTGDATTNSFCAQFSASLTPAGWFNVGGTSLSSPLWAAIIADRDSYQGRRSGDISPLLYLMAATRPGTYTRDLTPAGQQVTTNGLFAETRGYDMATGLGTPIMKALITQ
jgi:subtilase family serine protease